jgi:hypothetical protein
MDNAPRNNGGRPDSVFKPASSSKMLANRANGRPISQDASIIIGRHGPWIAYGLMQGDPVIIGANGVSFALVATLLSFKVRSAANNK